MARPFVTSPRLCEGFLATYLDGRDLYGRCAFVEGKRAELVLRLPRSLGTVGAELLLRCDETGEEVILPLSWTDREGNLDLYSVLLPASLRVGLWFFVPRIRRGGMTLLGQRTEGDRMIFVAEEEGVCRSFQLLIFRREHRPPKFLLGGVIYHIFVDRFFCAGEPVLCGDAVYNPDWEEGIPEYPPYPGAHLDNNMFFGGNLDGVTEKLPYIASLGVCCIYLSPIFRAYSNHKYDTGDYTRVDEAFGGDGALSRLVKAAKSFGIRIVLDGVFNHTGDDSVYFNRRGTYQSEESPYGNWYTFRRRPDDYECWWNIPILPRLRTDEPSCREFFLGKDGVIAKWTRAGVAGFRLDVADELSDSFIRGIRERLDENGEDTVLWGEVWEDASNKIAYDRRRRYYWGGELDGVMNYPLREGLLAYFRRGDTAPLRYALEEVLPAAPKAVADRQMNLLGTHDTLRILTALGGAEEAGKSNDELAHLRMTEEERRLALERLKLAYLALATLPGLPCIYYGDEVGMEGYRDPFNRLPFPWHRMDGELLAYYRAVGELRGKESLYREGELRLHTLTPSRLVFSRTDGSRCAVTVINRSQSPLPIRLPKGARVLFGNVGAAGGALPPMSGAVIRMRAGDVLSFSEQN